MARPPADSIAIETPERILAAAEIEFATHGLALARLSDIAARAGIRRPSLLHHFASKERLYEVVVRASFERLGGALRTCWVGQGAFVAQLAAVTRAFDAFLQAEPEVARLVVRELLAPGGPGQAVLLGEVAPLLDEIETWIVAAGGPRLRAGMPVRAAVLHVVSDALLQSASGALRTPLWGEPPPDTSWRIARTILLAEEPA